MSSDIIYCLSDQVIRTPGLYLLWSVLYIANIVCLCTDYEGLPGDSNISHQNCRNFNLFVSLFSHVYLVVSSWNSIYGNNIPSSFMHVSGSLHQFSFWLFVSYYAGDIFGSMGPVGVLNTIYCVVVAFFTFDTIIKSWHLVLYPETYREYVKKWSKPTQSSTEPTL